MQQSRRTFLKTSGAVAATGVTLGTAGCSSLPFLGGDGGGQFANWFYPPGQFGDADHYSFRRTPPLTIADNEDEFDEETLQTYEDAFESRYSFLDVDFDEVESETQFAGDTVAVLSDYEPPQEDVVDALEDGGFESETEHEGYELFLGENETRAVAIDGNDIVVCQSATVSRSVDGVRGDGGSGTEQDLRSIAYGESWQGTIDNDDPTENRGYHDPVTFVGTAGDVVTIDMVSEPGDPYLILLDPNGDSVASNDDYQSRDARIEEYELQQSGEYTIAATSFNGGSTFDYTLTLTVVAEAVDPVEVTTAAIDASEGEIDRYEDANEDLGELLDQIGGDIAAGETHEEYEETTVEVGRFEGGVARGIAYEFDGETTDMTWAAVFADEDDIDEDDLEDWADDGTLFSDWDDVEVSTSGRAGLVEGVIDTDDI